MMFLGRHNKKYILRTVCTLKRSAWLLQKPVLYLSNSETWVPPIVPNDAAGRKKAEEPETRQQ